MYEPENDINNVTHPSYASEDDEMSPETPHSELTQIRIRSPNSQSIASTISPLKQQMVNQNENKNSNSVNISSLFDDSPFVNNDSNDNNNNDNNNGNNDISSNQWKLPFSNNCDFIPYDSPCSSMAPSTSLSLPIHVNPNITLESLGSALVSPQAIMKCFSKTNNNNNSEQTQQKQNLRRKQTHMETINSSSGSSSGSSSNSSETNTNTFTNTNITNVNDPSLSELMISQSDLISDKQSIVTKQSEIDQTVSNLEDLIVKMQSNPISIIRDPWPHTASDSQSQSESLTIAIIDNNNNNKNSNNNNNINNNQLAIATSKQLITDDTIKNQLATIRETISTMLSKQSEKSSDASSLQSSDFIIINNKLSMAIADQYKQQPAAVSLLSSKQKNSIQNIQNESEKWIAFDQEFEIERMDRISKAMDFLVEMSLKCQQLVLKKKQLMAEQHKNTSVYLRKSQDSPIFHGSNLLKLWQSRPATPQDSNKHFFTIGDTTMKCDWILFVKCKNLIHHRNQLLWDISVHHRIDKFNKRQFRLRAHQWENSFNDKDNQPLWRFGSPRQLTIAANIQRTKSQAKAKSPKSNNKSIKFIKSTTSARKNGRNVRAQSAKYSNNISKSTSNYHSKNNNPRHFTFLTPSVARLSSKKFEFNNVFDRLSRPQKKKKIISTAEQEAQKCTFQPCISKKSRQISQNLGYPSTVSNANTNASADSKRKNQNLHNRRHTTKNTKQEFFNRLYSDAEYRKTKQKIAQQMAQSAKHQYFKDTCPFQPPSQSNNHFQNNYSYNITQIHQLNTDAIPSTYHQKLKSSTQYIDHFDVDSPSRSQPSQPSSNSVF